MSILSRLLPKKDFDDYLLTLSVEDHLIRAVISHITEDKIHVVGSGDSPYDPGEDESETVDIAISSAEKNLPENILVTKVIFVLPYEFIDGAKIRPEYLTRLKKITKDLQLKPQGFIDYTESIAYFLEKADGSPPTAILVAVNKKTLTFTLIRVGKIYQRISLNRSQSISTDLESILPKFESEIMPSSLILYDATEDLEKLKEELLKFSWSKHPEFLHTPKVRILTKTDVVTALVEASSSGLRKNLEIDFPHTPDEAVKEEKIEDSPEIDIPPEEKKGEAPVSKHESKPEEEVESFGFIKGEDIARMKEEHENIKVPSASSLPLMIEEEVKQDFVREEKVSEKPKKKIAVPKINLPDLSFINKIHFPSIIPVIAVLIFAALSLWFIFSFPKASINLIVLPKISANTITLNFTSDPKNITDTSSILLAREVSLEGSGEKTAPTSGKANVGDKATGTVVIYNKSLSGKTLPKETILKNGVLLFSLDDDTRIASASDTGEGLAYGKTTAKVTSVGIGTESNLTAGSIFSFKDFPESSYTAKNEQAFTGGTSREVASVSKEDAANLENILSLEVTSKIKQDLSQSLQQGEKLIDSSLRITTTSKKVSPEVGTQAKDLDMKLTVKISALAFNEKDLINLSKANLTSVPAGFTQDLSRLSIKINNIKEDKKGAFKADATITSFYIPEIDKVKIVKDLTGKSYQESSDYLKSVNSVIGVKIIPENQLPIFKNKLPFIKNNISINVVLY